LKTPNDHTSQKSSAEIDSFRGLWKGGYYEGDPFDPFGSSSYGISGYISVLYATYLTCIRPYVNSSTIALEIGPGRGAWTKTFLQAREVWCLDVLSAQHNRFWEYVGDARNVKYVQVSDLSCSILPDYHFDYLFSFGTFVHLSFKSVSEYMGNLYPKLKAGANCFVMVADYEKYARAMDNTRDALRVLDAFIMGKSLPGKILKVWLKRRQRAVKSIRNFDKDDDPFPGRFYHSGIDRTCEMLERAGYRVLLSDVGVVPRDPIVHFTK